jgi:penicillin-insensitive murein endopeptidase
MVTRARELTVWAACAIAIACGSAPPARPPQEKPKDAIVPSSTPIVITAPDVGVDGGVNAGSPAAPLAKDELVPPIAPPHMTAEAVLALPPSASSSIGSPGAGEVRGAVALPDQGPGFRHNDRRPYEARFGTVELVQALIKAAASFAEDNPLVINDLGLVNGGPIRQHGSHQSGRDVDVLFFSTDLKRQPVPSVGVPVDPKGRGIDFKDLAVRSDDVELRFDAKRTWRFMQSFLEVAGEEVQRIFIVEHVRTMLLAEAERVKAPKKIKERFEMVTCQPETPHDDHMHIRLFCSADDIAEGCIDSSPMFPARRQALKKLGVTPVLESFGARHERTRKAGVDERTTSMEEARVKIEKSGPMHARVRAFLDQREAWAKKPAVGRQYCK